MTQTAPRYLCAACRARGKPWKGDDPRCAFDNKNRLFQEDNWSCATVEGIRDLCYEGQAKLPPGVDYQYCDDQKYASINIDKVELEGSGIGLCLWLTWYKSRGSTDEMWLMNPRNAILDSPYPLGAPRPPTEDEVLAITAYYKAQAQRLAKQG